MAGSMTRLLVLFVVLLGFAVPAGAQDLPRVEVSGGYQYLNERTLAEELDEGNIHGWYADVAGNVNRWLSVVGEVTGAYKSIDFFGVASVDVNVHTFMGGVRLSSRSNARVVPFGQVLFGVARGSFGASVFGESIGDESSTEFALQPGGGVNFMVSDAFGVRVAADYRRIAVDEGSNEFRVAVGAVVSFGRR